MGLPKPSFNDLNSKFNKWYNAGWFTWAYIAIVIGIIYLVVVDFTQKPVINETNETLMCNSTNINNTNITGCLDENQTIQETKHLRSDRNLSDDKG